MMRRAVIVVAIILAVLQLTACSGGGAGSTLPGVVPSSVDQKSPAASQVCGTSPLTRSRAATGSTRLPADAGPCCYGFITDTCCVGYCGGDGGGLTRGGGCDPADILCVSIGPAKKFPTTAESTCTSQGGRFVSTNSGFFYCRYPLAKGNGNPVIYLPGGCPYVVNFPDDPTHGRITVTVVDPSRSITPSGDTDRGGVRVGVDSICYWTATGPYYPA
jgi:hypothetical protein